MEQYRYNITGEYKDWCEIYKGESIIHEGSLLGLVSKLGNETFLNINYGTKKIFQSILKSNNNLTVAVPKEPDFFQSDYTYQCLIFDNEEFKEFIDNIYFDRELLEKSQKISKEDIVNAWMLTYPNRKNYLSINEMKTDIINHILFFSEDACNVDQLNSIIDNSELSINQIPVSYENIIIYVDSDEGVYEWNGLIKIDNVIYLKLDENYYVK